MCRDGLRRSGAAWAARSEHKDVRTNVPPLDERPRPASRGRSSKIARAVEPTSKLSERPCVASARELFLLLRLKIRWLGRKAAAGPEIAIGRKQDVFRVREQVRLRGVGGHTSTLTIAREWIHDGIACAACFSKHGPPRLCNLSCAG